MVKLFEMLTHKTPLRIPVSPAGLTRGRAPRVPLVPDSLDPSVPGAPLRHGSCAGPAPRCWKRPPPNCRAVSDVQRCKRNFMIGGSTEGSSLKNAAIYMTLRNVRTQWTQESFVPEYCQH